VFSFLCCVVSAGCEGGRAPGIPEENQAIEPIEDVLNDHAPALMKIEGVVGVYVGALDDGKPCLVIMLRDEGPEERNEIPRTIGGYPVKLEVGGDIRPLRP